MWKGSGQSFQEIGLRVLHARKSRNQVGRKRSSKEAGLVIFKSAVYDARWWPLGCAPGMHLNAQKTLSKTGRPENFGDGEAAIIIADSKRFNLRIRGESE